MGPSLVRGAFAIVRRGWCESGRNKGKRRRGQLGKTPMSAIKVIESVSEIDNTQSRYTYWCHVLYISKAIKQLARTASILNISSQTGTLQAAASLSAAAAVGKRLGTMSSRLEKAGSRFKPIITRGVAPKRSQPSTPSSSAESPASVSVSVPSSRPGPSKDPVSLLPPSGNFREDDSELDLPAGPLRAPPRVASSLVPTSSGPSAASSHPKPSGTEPNCGSTSLRPPSVSAPEAPLIKLRSGPGLVIPATSAAAGATAAAAAAARRTNGPGRGDRATAGAVPMGNLRPPGTEGIHKARSVSRALSRTPAPDAGVLSAYSEAAGPSQARQQATQNQAPSATPETSKAPTAASRVAPGASRSGQTPPSAIHVSRNRAVHTDERGENASHIPASERAPDALSEEAGPSVREAGSALQRKNATLHVAASLRSHTNAASKALAPREAPASEEEEEEEEEGEKEKDVDERLAASQGLTMLALSGNLGEKGHTDHHQDHQESESTESESNSEHKFYASSKSRRNQIKKPLSPYMLYSQSARRRLREEDPDRSFADLAKTIGANWRKMTAQERAPWHQKAGEARQAYHSAMAEQPAEESGSDDSSGLNAAESTAKSHPNGKRRAAPSKKKDVFEEPEGTKTRKGRRSRKPHEPKRPPSAYSLFASVRADRQVANPTLNSVDLTANIAYEWKTLSSPDREEFEEEAAALKSQYLADRQKWIKEYPEEQAENSDDESRDKMKAAKQDRILQQKKSELADAIENISDEEREWEEYVKVHGEDASRPDPFKISIDSLTPINYKMGRPRPRTFQLARVYRNVKTKGKFPLPETDEGQAQQTNTGNGAGNRRYNEEEEEEIVGDIDDESASRARSARSNDYDEEEDEDDRPSMAGSTAPSEASHTFRRSQHAVRTRIVDGKIVVDEASLQINRAVDADEYDDAEVVEEREDQDFSNSASYSKRKHVNRWTAEETMRFLEAVSMWGTDFEMIARLFPGRDRRQIKTKWQREEKNQPLQLREAFAIKRNITAVEYGEQIGMDLSGPTPIIVVKPPPALEGLSDGEDADGSTHRRERSKRSAEPQSETEWEEEEVIETGADGEEIVTMQRVRKRPDGRQKRQRSQSVTTGKDKDKQRSSSHGLSRERSQGRDHAHRGDVLARRLAEAANEPEEEVVGFVE
ncbi:hypothetical protein K437DRAFT_173035 [Tilletiaria anomala UBC 951]|uniref:HMG box domain-containing protein n=1 Tax=Tilletiaria anomala (strain ATCC 24038 / CBS 436.72 / UBC 951) TaxID=1037660 RepID=A0A066VMM7_TILAU|nr:uncharacterized protein K437DRAFT_173035 [Tilletiaria anomala UBC 951]KDN41533.1 hypothetical protein K437DRAFT_173035 [Tilletiaria anomala UBC 951]